MREWILAGAAAALFVAGCASSEEAPPAPAPAQAPAGQPPAPPPPPSAPQAQGAEWEQILQNLRKSYEVQAAAQTTQADEHYRLAERWFQAGDFEKAKLECEKALQINGNHAPARALKMEVEFYLGQGRPTPTSEEYDKYLREALVRHQQTLVEIDNAIAAGQRNYNAGEYDKAEREFRKVLEYAKWMPTGIELETRRKEALHMLDQTKAARRQKELDEAKQRDRLIDEEKRREDYTRMIAQKRELELLFGQAQMYFEQERYMRCIEICDKILYINPQITSVEEMKNVAQRLNHMKEGRDNLKNYIEQWKRTFEQIELNSVTQAGLVEFPDMETWKELIAKRKPKGIAELEEDIKDEDKTILDKLKSIRITIDMQNAPLSAIIDYIREISGLNMHISGVDNADSEMISFKVSDIVLDGALKLMLAPRQLAYIVRDGVVLITKADQVKKQVKLELYDVQDLTYGMKDFPGVDISLSQDQIGTTVQAGEEESKNFTGEDLAGLIKGSVHKGEWEEADGKSIQFQNGLLIIRNSVEMHRNVRKFLSDLRASTSMLVSIQVRFLSVEDDFLQQVGMDFRDVTGARVQGITNLADINPTVVGVNPQFIAPGGGLGAQTAGITGVFGNSVARSMGARIQNIMNNDFLVQQFFNQVLGPLGGASFSYTLLDDISFNMLLRAVTRTERNHVLTAPKLTVFNTQRGNMRIANQMAYVRDYDVQIATAAVALEPIVDVVQDGISLDCRPIVSADRKFITMELRPTVATLFPAPPQIFNIITRVTVPGAPITDALPIQIETPILQIQRVRTTVVVPDRGTLMIGGLTVYFDEDTTSSIPLWRSIPILGNIGSLKVKGLERKQTLIIVQPTIVIPDEEERKRF